MGKGTLQRILCLYIVNAMMLPCLPRTDKGYHNQPLGEDHDLPTQPRQILPEVRRRAALRQEGSHHTSVFSSGLWHRRAGVGGWGVRDWGGGCVCVPPVSPPGTKSPVPRRKVLKCKASSQLFFSLLVAFGSVKLWIPIAWTGHMWISSNPANPVPKCFFVCGGNTHRSKWKWP